MIIVHENGGDIVCGGSIVVDRRHVLTAAHCIAQEDLEDLLILSNTRYSKPGIGIGETRHHVEKARIHQAFVTIFNVTSWYRVYLKPFPIADFWGLS